MVGEVYAWFGVLRFGSSASRWRCCVRVGVLVWWFVVGGCLVGFGGLCSFCFSFAAAHGLIIAGVFRGKIDCLFSG